MIHPPTHYFIYDWQILSPYSVLSIITQGNKTTIDNTFQIQMGVFNFNMGNVAKRPPFDTWEPDSE